MRNLWSLTARELTAMFLSPLTYIIVSVFLLWNGLWFLIFLGAVGGDVDQTYGLMLGNSLLYWIVAIVIPAAITFQRISSEKKSGVLEMTMTAPVTDVEYVLAKFLGPAVFWVLLWLPTVFYSQLMAQFGQAPETGPLLAGYLGVILTGCVFIAVDLMISALTTSPIVALLIAFFANFALVILPLGLRLLAQRTEWLAKVVQYIDLSAHFQSFGEGLVDSRAIVYYLSSLALALFLSVRAVEARKWR